MRRREFDTISAKKELYSMDDNDDFKIEPVPQEAEEADAAEWAESLPQQKRTIVDWMALGLSEEEAKDAVMTFGNDEAIRASFPDSNGGSATVTVDVEQARPLEPSWDNRASSYKPGKPAKGFLIFTPEQYDQALRAALIRFKDKFPTLPPKDTPEYARALGRWNRVRDLVEEPLIARKQLAAKEMDAARGGYATEDVKKAIQEAGLDVSNLPDIDIWWTNSTQLTPENFAKYGGAQS